MLLSPLCVGAALPVLAGEPQEFYETAKEGWFWYHDPAPEPEPEEKEQEQAQGQPAAEPGKPMEPRNPSLDNYTTQDLWDMHPDDFQALLTGVHKKAVQHPSEQNILEYLSMQDMARRKALAYTNASQFVTQKYSNLFNVNQVYPVTAPGVAAKVQTQEQEIGGTIMAARENHALLFFVAKGCGFCEKQAAILIPFAEKYGWKIKAVDIGQESALAARFNITTTPTLLLIRQGNQQHMPVSVGVVALSELERRLYRAIRYLDGGKPDSFTTYDYQKGTAFDPGAILEKPQPWREQ